MIPCCKICGVELNQPGKVQTKDCGGDCLLCMANVGCDPDCISELIETGNEDLITPETMAAYQEDLNGGRP